MSWLLSPSSATKITPKASRMRATAQICARVHRHAVDSRTNSGRGDPAATFARVKVLLLVNSSASSVTARGRVMIQKALSADHEVTLAETSRRGHATRLAQGAAADGIEVVVVLGGDGTLNEAANGLAGTDTALAALPGGSTNVFARTLGLPDDAIEATVVLLEALARSSIRRVGLGVVNGRYFLFHCRHGVRRGHRRPGRAARRRSSATPAIRCSCSPPSRPGSATTTTPGRASPCTCPAATSSTTCTSGSASTRTPTPTSVPGRSTWPRAPPSTPGWPWCRSARSSSPPSSASGCRRSARATASGAAGPSTTAADLAGVRVEGYGPFPYQVDGDYLGEVTSLEFRHEPESLASSSRRPAASADPGADGPPKVEIRPR